MKISKRLLLIIAVLSVGAVFLHKLISSYEEFEQKKIQAKLHKTHSDAIIRAQAGINVYAALVSSIKSYTKNKSAFPEELELQSYLNDILKDIKFNDSIVISYYDNNHIFKYVITPNAIDPMGKKGDSAKLLLGKKRLAEFQMLLKTDDIHLLHPINVKEGWVGFPFIFDVKDKQNNYQGYITPIIDVNYLLNYFYESDKENEFVHKFIVEDSLDLTREAFYNETPIYNTNKDPEYYKNFNNKDDNFIYTGINLFGLNLKVGSAYKTTPKTNNITIYFGYLWYTVISLAILIIFYQYLKNNTLNKKLELANTDINFKNIELEKSLSKIQTLIKEIHHRVKNNIQMISGVLTLQQDETDNTQIKSALEQSKSRIHSMALVHEKLYSSVSLQDINTKEYTEQLVEFVDNTIGNKDLNVQKTITIDDSLIFDGDTTSNIGLIMNELATNSYKYAFKPNTSNILEISILKEGEYYVLTYSDNGSGLPENYNFELPESLGIQLIQILADQLKGKIDYSNIGKSTFKIHFKPIDISFSE